jgi:hypothetical protein
MRLTTPLVTSTVAGPMRCLDLWWAQWRLVSDPQPGGASRPLERFPCSSRVYGVIALAVLAFLVALVLLDGFGLTHAAILAAFVLGGLAVWLTMIRPTVDLYKDHILVRNALTDVMVPWHLVESAEVRQVLVIRTAERDVHGIAIGRSARQQMRRGRAGSGSSPLAGAGGGAATSRMPVFGGEGDVRIDYADAVVSRIDNLSAANRRASERLTTVDKSWRRPEVIALIGVAVVFAVLLALAIVV